MPKGAAFVNQSTKVGCVKRSFSPLAATSRTGLSPSTFAALEAERALRPDRAAVGVLASWREQDGARRSAGRVLFFDEGSVDPLALSLGRHTACDVAGIPGAALRHGLLLLWPGAPDEAPRMEALDLRTGIGLSVGTRAPALHVEGSGAVRFGVGAAEVLVLPAARGAPLVPQGAARLLEDLSAKPAPVRVSLDVRAAPRVPVGGTSVVWAQPSRRMSPDQALYELRATPTTIVTRVAPPDPPRASRVLVQVEAADVVEGVLLGRYERCRGFDELSRHQNVSRVHALLLARGGRTWVLDAGSTNGTTILDARGEVKVELDEERRVWRLGDGERIRLWDVEVLLHVAGETPNVPGVGEA